jgi:ribonuclease HI
MSLKLLLLFAIEKNVNSIQVFGDSQMVVKWIWNINQCHNILLIPLLEEVQRLMASFDYFDIQHVYRERNMMVDLLSKEGLQMEHGQWMISEENNGTFYEYYHRPFIDQTIQAQ